ncbi:hypothetical protein ACH5RR_025115 [Cinchona calisaya]|uniref:Uncharacterized protein n=1 Tax=Cinchona calisaya TaxID=153742 RepID=A0ABD2YYP4_9GENT
MSISGNRNVGAHVLLFPVPTMSGHTIPILDLAKKLISRVLNITVLVTPSTQHLLNSIQNQLIPHHSNSLQSLVLSIPEPLNSSMAAEIRAASERYSPILEWFQSHPSPPVAIISDFFLGWTQKLATGLNIPRIVFWPAAALPSLILNSLWENISDFVNVSNANTIFSFPNIPNSPVYPLWQIDVMSSKFKKGDPAWEFVTESFLSNYKGWCAVYSTFEQLEGVFLDAVKKEMGHHRVWGVGPFFHPPPMMISVVGPVCAAVLTSGQVGSLAAALECSGVHFIWRVNAAECGLIPQGYEDQVAGREGLANGVMILTWPIQADQFLNARFLVDDIGVAIKACEGGKQTIPEPGKLAEVFVQSIKSDHPKRELVRRLFDMAKRAAEDQGSSSKDLDALVQQLNELKFKN